MDYPFCIDNIQNSKKLIPITCIALLALSSLPLYYLIGVADAETVFSDNFSSGNFNQWTTKYTSSGASLSVSNGVAQFNTLAGGNGGYSYVIKSGFTSTTTKVITASQDVYMSEVPSGFASGLGAIFILQVTDVSNNGNIHVSIDGSQKWGIYVGTYPTFTYSMQTKGSSPQSNVWYHLDLSIDNPNHTVTLSVNGTVVVSVSQNQFTDKTHTIFVGSGAEDYCNTGRAHSLKVDNVKLVISGSSSPSPTPTATPTPTSTATITPSPTPTATPTPTPTTQPTTTPTPKPTASPTPTPKPTATPTPTPTPPPSGALFSDDFSSGNFNQWTTKYTSQGSSQTVSSGIAQFDTPPGGNGVGSYLAKSSFSSTAASVITLSQDVYMTEVPSGFTSGLGAVFILDISDSSSLNNGNILVSIDGSQKWGIYIGESTFTYAIQTSGSSPQSNNWYHLDLTIDNPNQKVTLAVNGSTVVSATQNQFSGSFHTIDLAVGIIQDWCNNGRAHQLRVDNVKLGISGFTPPSPTPTPTVSPTITPTPTPTTKPSPTPNPTGIPTYKQQTLSVPISASWIASDATVYAGINNAVYKSTDGAQTWTELLSFGSNVNIHYVYVSIQDYVFIAPSANAPLDQLGIWRSTNGGQTWTRVLALPAGCTTMSMAEDSTGNLFVGVYTTGSYAANARIYKSTNSGASWTSVYYDPAARHVHCVTVDPANNYVYASIGDVRVWNGITGSNWDIEYVVRSNADGNPGTWSKILQGTANTGDAQMIAIHVIDTVSADGSLTPQARLFATDYDNGQIFRTTDDVNFVKVLDSGAQSYGFWVRTNSLNGVIYASFVGGDGSSRTAGIWISSDNGVSWTKYMDFPVNQPNQGSTTASNFHHGVLYFNVIMLGEFQSGIKLYPEYSTSSMMSLNVEAGAVAVAAAQWAVFCALFTTVMAVLVSRKICRTKTNLPGPQ